MKLLRITTHYPSYIKDFYLRNPGLSDKSYNEQKTILDTDAFGWSDSWFHSLSPLGYEVMEVSKNVEPMQRTWAGENDLHNPTSLNLEEIAFAQVKKFKPEVLWIDDLSGKLLKRIRSDVPSVRLVLGWVGSAMLQTEIWRQTDLVLSCAQESVDRLRSAGIAAAQLHHGFDPRINARLKNGPKTIDFSFIGQLIRSNQFHLHRDRLLEKLSSEMEILIFSPSANINWRETGTAILMMACYDVANILKNCGLSNSSIKIIPAIGKAAHWPFRPVLPVNRKIKPFMKDPLFGLKMFQILRDSKVNLNIHADSSPVFASNMRLFESTGVGTCLLTDWKGNIGQLFEPDKEIVVYKSFDECLEKAKWLLGHPKERDEIGLAGQKRTLKDHTYANRAVELHHLITCNLQ